MIHSVGLISRSTQLRLKWPFHSIPRFPMSFPFFVFECCTLLVSRVFPVSARVSARVFNNKRKDTERDTRHLSTHLYVPTSSRHPLSDLATQPIRLATLAPIDLWFCTFWPDATGTLWQDWAPSPVCYGAPHGRFGLCWQCGFPFSLLLVLPLWQFLVFPCFLCCLFGQLVLFCMPFQAVFFLSVLDVLFESCTEFGYVCGRTYGSEDGLKEASYVCGRTSRG